MLVDYKNQIYYPGEGPLDKKNEPVETFEDLSKIPAAARYIGMTKIVKNGLNGLPSEYIFNGTDKFNGKWEVKTADVKAEEGTDENIQDGHIEIKKNDKGAIYGVMYYDGDDKE